MEGEILTLSDVSDEATRIYNKTSIPESAPSKNKIFQILFLLQDDDRVEVIETEKIDIELLMDRLEKGQSVFITPKLQRKFIPPNSRRKISPFKSPVKERKPWYFAHL
ncbi:MAG: hypothetical protein QXM52_04805 [Candidatus Bathyarchaeia archaeon]